MSVPGVVAGLVDGPMEREETAESCETSDEVEPRRAPRRVDCVVTLLGGMAGDDWFDGVLEGRGGGAVLDAIRSFCDDAVSRPGNGGGAALAAGLGGTAGDTVGTERLADRAGDGAV